MTALPFASANFGVGRAELDSVPLGQPHPEKFVVALRIFRPSLRGRVIHLFATTNSRLKGNNVFPSARFG